MGTSSRSGGPASNSSLVPTFLEEPAPGPLPGAADPGAEEDGDPGDEAIGDGEPAEAPPPRPPIEAPPEPARFQTARGNFTRFARSGGNDRGALRRAVSDYVRSGARGGSNAMRRMGSARATAANVLGVLRGFERDGVEATLRQLKLGRLVGKPADEVLAGLTEVVCADGGSIDEGIARDAWLETVSELERLGIENLDALSADQTREFIFAFIAHSIETRLFQDIGTNGLGAAADVASIEAFERQFRDYIRRSVRDSFSTDLGPLADRTDDQIREIIDRTYREAWELLDLWGDVEE